MIIRAKGIGRVDRPAEVATLILTVEHEHPDAGASMSATQAIAAELHRDLGAIPEDALTHLAVGAPRTSTRIPYSNENPYGRKGAGPVPLFVTALDFRATFAQIDALNAVAARWGNRAGVSLGAVQWSLTEATRREAEDAALAAAVAQARHRAEVMAESSGADDLRLRELGDPAPASSMPAFASFARAPGPEEAVPASGQDVTVTAQVEAVFEATAPDGR